MMEAQRLSLHTDHGADGVPSYWTHRLQQPRDGEVHRHRETTDAGPVSESSQVFSRECGFFSWFLAPLCFWGKVALPSEPWCGRDPGVSAQR